MILTSGEIVALCKKGFLMSPFLDKATSEHGPSAGPSVHGYDVRVGTRYKKPVGSRYIIPGTTEIHDYDYEGGLIPSDGVHVMPRETILLETMESFVMPKDICAFVFNKSTWSKLFFLGPNTVIDAGYEGGLTLAFHNCGAWSVTIKQNMGLAHLVFSKTKESKDPYNGKYQGQKGVTGAL